MRAYDTGQAVGVSDATRRSRPRTRDSEATDLIGPEPAAWSGHGPLGVGRSHEGLAEWAAGLAERTPLAPAGWCRLRRVVTEHPVGEVAQLTLRRPERFRRLTLGIRESGTGVERRGAGGRSARGDRVRGSDDETLDAPLDPVILLRDARLEVDVLDLAIRVLDDEVDPGMEADPVITDPDRRCLELALGQMDSDVTGDLVEAPGGMVSDVPDRHQVLGRHVVVALRQLFTHPAGDHGRVRAGPPVASR